MTGQAVARALAFFLLLASAPLSAGPAAAQLDGATMTVLRGEVAVTRPDGSAVQPAPSGTTVFPGDQISTLTQAGALVTFFTGIEIEMGEQTILVVDRVSRTGDRVDVSLRQILGVTLNRLATFADPGSSYRIDAGGAVAVVRGTRFMLLGPTDDGTVVLVCLGDNVAGLPPVPPGTGGCDPLKTTFTGEPVTSMTGYLTRVEGGRIAAPLESFAPDFSAGPWNAAFEGAMRGQEETVPEEENDNDGANSPNNIP